MASLFSKIIAGEIPAHFVWQDTQCVGFLVIDPQTDGHVVVVPRAEVDSWLDADDDLMAHLMRVARRIGQAQQTEWSAARVGVLIEGFLVPHLHVHVWPANSHEDFDVNKVTRGQDQRILAENATRLRARLRALGEQQFVPPETD